MPRPDKKTIAQTAEERSRKQKMREEGIALPLPPCRAPFLVDYLLQIGPTVPGGMGAAAIGWRDIVAWQECTGIALPPWQAKLLRHASAEYLAMARDAEKPDCPQPWLTGEQVAENRQVVGKAVVGLFDGLAAKSADVRRPRGRGRHRR